MDPSMSLRCSANASLSDKEKLKGREREWWVKAPAHVCSRLAGTLTYLDWATSDRSEPRNIGIPFVTAAVDLVSEYFWPHARAASTNRAAPEVHFRARRALRWIRREDRKEWRDDLQRRAFPTVALMLSGTRSS